MRIYSWLQDTANSIQIFEDGEIYCEIAKDEDLTPADEEHAQLIVDALMAFQGEK